MKKIYVLLACLIAMPSFASILYVDKNATGTNAGTSWANAYTTIELAFANSIVGDQIWIAAGVYKPAGTTRSATFTIPNGVSVYGSFAATETAVSQRDFSNGATTTLNGDIGAVGVATDNCYSVVKFTNVSNLTLFDGFKIVNGYNNSSTSGGAIYNSGGQPTIKNCELIANYATKGGGFGNATTAGNTTTLINCKIRSNSATDGGAVYNGSGTLKIIGCDLTSNTANYGGAIHVEFDTVLVDRTILSGNSGSSSGGAIYLDNADSSIELYNSLMMGNFAPEKAVMGMNSPASNPQTSKVINCTIVNNRNTGTSPNSSFIMVLPYAGCAFYNNIMTNNISPRVLLNGTVVNCIIDADFLPASATNVSTTAPTFVTPNNAAAAPFNADGFNYSLASGSAGIDTGSNSLLSPLYTLDLAGNARTSNGIVDNGAYESLPLGTGDLPEPAKKLQLYPNPTSGIVNLENVAVATGFKMYNSTGILVKQGTIGAAATKIDLSSFSTGLYFLQLENGEVHKIIRK